MAVQWKREPALIIDRKILFDKIPRTNGGLTISLQFHYHIVKGVCKYAMVTGKCVVFHVVTILINQTFELDKLFRSKCSYHSNRQHFDEYFPASIIGDGHAKLAKVLPRFSPMFWFVDYLF